MRVFEILLGICIVIAVIALVLVSVNSIKIIKSNRDKTIADVENKLDKNLSAMTFLAIAAAVLFVMDIMIR